MTEIEKLKADIQTRKLCTMDEHMAFYNQEAESDYNLLDRIEKVLNHLPEEPASEDKEEAWRKAYEKEKDEILVVYDHHAGFVAGGNWKEQQMMKDAIEAVINSKENDLILYQSLPAFITKNDWHSGDKVKLIIIKEEEK